MKDYLLAELVSAIHRGHERLDLLSAKGGDASRVSELRDILSRLSLEKERWDSLSQEEKTSLRMSAYGVFFDGCKMLDDILEEEKKQRYIAESQKDVGRQLNKAKLEKNQPIIQRRREIIAELFRHEELSDSEKFAEAIKLDLDKEFERLGIKPASVRTIRRDVQAILAGHPDRVRKK